jgi:hypothetical protein
MTTRSFDAADLVPLPVLDATSAVALGHKLFTRAKREELTKAETVALRRLRHAHTALRDANRARLEAEPAVTIDRKEAYRQASAAFAGMYAWISGWASLPQDVGGDKALAASKIMNALFAEGMRFTLLPHDAGWVEADERVRWLLDNDGEQVFKKLGGSEFFEHVRASHTRCGVALGITRLDQQKSESAKIRAPLDAFCARLREYVVQLAARASIGGEDAKERVERLLVPLARWDSRRIIRQEVEPSVPPPAEPSAPELAPASPVT